MVDKRDWHSKQQHQDSSSSSSSEEDEEDPRDVHMEVDTADRMFLPKISIFADILFNETTRLQILLEISAWGTTEQPNTTGTVLPPVNPWETPSSEPVESTGWANFANFENTLSIESTTNEDKKTACDELKEKTSETTAADLKEKIMVFSNLNEREGDDKNRDCTSSNQMIETDSSAMETNLNSSSGETDENKEREYQLISVDENINSNELPDNRYLYIASDFVQISI